MASYLNNLFTTTANLLAGKANYTATLQATVTVSITPGWTNPPSNTPLASQANFPLTYQQQTFAGQAGSASLTIKSTPLVEISGLGANGSFVPVSGPTPSVIYGTVGSAFVSIALCNQVIAKQINPPGQ